MRISILTIGRPGRLLAGAVGEYERRAGRYWPLDVVEVREEKAARGRPEEQIRDTESTRLLERVPVGAEVVALTRGGEAWSSTRLARYLADLAVHGRPGAAFLVGGALGLSEPVIRGADRALSLSPLTLTHELARLILAEQIYRAGTIVRGEPYHKAAD